MTCHEIFAEREFDEESDPVKDLDAIIEETGAAMEDDSMLLSAPLEGAPTKVDKMPPDIIKETGAIMETDSAPLSAPLEVAPTKIDEVSPDIVEETGGREMLPNIDMESELVKDFDALVGCDVAFELYLQDGLFDRSEGRFVLEGEIDESGLDAFCKARRKTEAFLSITRLQKKMASCRHKERIIETIVRAQGYQLCIAVFQMLYKSQKERNKAKTKQLSPCYYSLIYDTGALFGLTPFRSDFIDYVKCEIKVGDISKVNTVVGIGTTLHRFISDEGLVLWLPCLLYHLPSAKVGLFSPQTYHSIYRGHSWAQGDHVDLIAPLHGTNHTAVIPIDR